MKRTLLVISLAAVAVASPAEARKKKKVDATAAEKPADSPATPAPGAGVGAEVHVSTDLALPAPAANPLPPPGVVPPPAATPPQPQMVVVGQRPFKELAIGGAAAIGGAYVLSVLVGAFSYAGFYDGQWGWFVPLAGPGLAMGGVGGEPAGCLSKAAYTYSLGPILTLIYLGGIATTIAGAVAKRDVMGPAPATAAPQAPALQVAPTVGAGSAGMILLGTF